jgi:hypothetical protein
VNENTPDFKANCICFECEVFLKRHFQAQDFNHMGTPPPPNNNNNHPCRYKQDWGPKLFVLFTHGALPTAELCRADLGESDVFRNLFNDTFSVT